MLVTAIGTHTPYAYWGFAFIGHILNEHFGENHRIHCLTTDELRDACMSIALGLGGWANGRKSKSGHHKSTQRARPAAS